MTPISVRDAKRLFADWKTAPALLLAVSGGPDSIALMWLAARWRRGLTRGPRLVAVTVDHGLRAEAAAEAREVKRLARTLELEHRTLRWTGAEAEGRIAGRGASGALPPAGKGGAAERRHPHSHRPYP